MASIGAELSLAQRFEPLVFISGVLNPWVIGFAGVIVICAASNYSPGGPPGAPAALCGDGEPKSSHGTRSGGNKRILARRDVEQSRQSWSWSWV